MTPAHCPGCARALRLPAAALGKLVRCPGCKHAFRAPAPPAAGPADEFEVVEDSPPAPGGFELVNDAPSPPPDPSPKPLRRAVKATAIDDNDEPAPQRKRAVRKKRPAPRRAFPLRSVVAGVAALVAVVGVGRWALGPGAADDPALARVPKFNAKTESTIYHKEIPPADAATWRVRPESADPAPAGLLTALAIPKDFRPQGLLFGDPASATAVVLGTPPLTKDGALAWLRYRLDRPGPPTLVSPAGGGEPFLPDRFTGFVGLALSPLGRTLALRRNWAPGATPEGSSVPTGAMSAFNEGGSLLRTWSEVGDVRWWGFATESRLVVLTDSELVLRDLETGAAVWTRPLPKARGSAALTPRRTWVLVAGENGVEAFATADGAPAGSLPIPGLGEWGGVGLAVGLGGERLAATTRSECGLGVVTWNLADGTPTSARYPVERMKWLAGTKVIERPAPAVQWAGRRLLVGGELYDPDLGVNLCEFRPDALAAGATAGSPVPDGRLWRVVRPPPDHIARLAAALGPDRAAPNNIYLTAANPPAPALAAALEAGTVWARAKPLRIEIGGTVPSRHKSALLAVMADELAERGYRVDPRAEFTARFIGKGVSTFDAPGGTVIKENAGGAANQRPMQLRNRVDGYTMVYALELDNGRVRARYPEDEPNNPKGGMSVDTPDLSGEGRLAGWRAAVRQSCGLLPRLAAWGAGGERMAHTPLIAAGADGLVEPGEVPP